MNKFKLLLLLLIPISVKASCTNQELSKYKALASNINSYYEYNDKFNLTVYNVSNELKLINKNDNTTYTNPSGIGEIKINNLNPGQNITLGIYPNNGECSSYRIRTIYVNLPYLNKYYQEEICTNNNNPLCSKWVNTNNYTKEQFINEVEKEKQEEQVEPESEPEVKSFSFIEFLGDFYIPILLVIIIGGSIGIYFLNKKQRFDF